MEKIISRLAPSPSGYLHLGNAWSFVMCWLICRSMDGKLVLRIDDLDPERSRPHFTRAIIEDLRWLGLDWDNDLEESGAESYLQSARGEFYSGALEILRTKGMLYPCFCSRRELRMMANAPHGSAREEPFINCPCAALSREQVEKRISDKRKYALKFRTGYRPISFNDLVYSHREYAPDTYGGDFALMRSDGVFSYQLASALDDALMGVNLVVRGNDLLESCPKQILLLESLGFRIPAYAHLPLILDGEGERLAKRHASLSLRALREKGVRPEQVLGQIAQWANIQASPAPIVLPEMLKAFSLDKIPTSDIRISASPLNNQS